ncbi:galactosyldiacylglycerol synthase [soil metagenome]|jgi:UDP-N-acetylglucosamine:LPS N-acetylglucosamine transferase
MSTRVLIFTASIGAGHDQPARVLAGGLRERDCTVEVVDGLELAGPVARTIISRASRIDSGAGNAAFNAGYQLATRIAPLRRAGTGALDRLTRAGFETFLRDHPADVLISTYPLWSQLLGRMRAGGSLQTPVVSAITDLAALHLWAHPGIDLHLVTHPESTTEVRSIAGPGARIEAVHGLTDLGFTNPPERSVARTELDLSTRGSLVVVSGGGWGVGDLPAATDTALHYGADTVVVLVGHNEAARERMQAAYADDSRVQVWGFTDRMVTLLSAADVLIHSTAGLTVLEALMCDCRVISYGWERGHIRANNRAYEQLGMVSVARNRPQLAHALIYGLAAPPTTSEVPDLPGAADLVLGLSGRAPLAAG